MPVLYNPSSQLWKTKKAVKNSSIPELYVRETWIPHNFRKK